MPEDTDTSPAQPGGQQPNEALAARLRETVALLEQAAANRALLASVSVEEPALLPPA